MKIFKLLASVKYPHSDADIALEEAEKKFGTGVVKIRVKAAE